MVLLRNSLSNSPCPLGRARGRSRYILLARAINNKLFQCSNGRDSLQWHRYVTKVVRNIKCMLYNISQPSRCKLLEYEVHTDMTNMRKYASPLCWWCYGAWLGCQRLRRLTGGGHSAVEPFVAEAGFFPALDKVRPICSPLRSCVCTDTLRTTGY